MKIQKFQLVVGENYLLQMNLMSYKQLEEHRIIIL